VCASFSLTYIYTATTHKNNTTLQQHTATRYTHSRRRQVDHDVLGDTYTYTAKTHKNNTALQQHTATTRCNITLQQHTATPHCNITLQQGILTAEGGR